MKSYNLVLLILSLLVVFGCSDNKHPAPKTQDSEIQATASKNSITNKSTKDQKSVSKPIADEISRLSTSSHVSGFGSEINRTQNSQHISGQPRIGDQPPNSLNISGFQTHVSGNVERPHFSGQ